MPKYCGENFFTHGRFTEVGQKQKTERKRRERKERLNDGDNNGQATHGAHKHASTHGACKPPGQKLVPFLTVKTLENRP